MTLVLVLIAAVVLLVGPSGATFEPRATLPPAGELPSPPRDESGPITITAGGTYSGDWQSTSSVPAIRIATSEPVTIVDSTVTNLAGGTLVESPRSVEGDLTIERVTAYGGTGRFLVADHFRSVTVRSSTIYRTRGIELAKGLPGSSVLITRNRHRNIQGNGVSPVGNFVQFRVVQDTAIEVSWNEIVNEHDKSNPEDIISLYHTSNARILDNMLWHQSKPGNAYDTSSQNGITIDSSSPGPGCHNNVIARNQVVDGYGIVSYVIHGGSNNLLLANRVVSDGRLPSGVRNGNGWVAMRVRPGGANNHAHGNVIGYVNRDGRRKDMLFEGAPEGDSAERTNNRSVRGKVTAASERREWLRWLAKLADKGIRVGA